MTRRRGRATGGAPRRTRCGRDWARRNALDARSRRAARRLPRAHQADPAELRRRRASRAWRSAVLPVAFAAVAQAIVVISGGIDLSVGSMMALTSVTAAVLMKGQGDGVRGRRRPRRARCSGLLVGAINGALIVVTRVPDIVVTLAMSFVWAGAALLVLNTPGGGAAEWLKGLVSGSLGSEWLPRALVVLVVVVGVGLDPAAAVDARACRSTRSAAIGWPPSAAASPSAGRRSSPTR